MGKSTDEMRNDNESRAREIEDNIYRTEAEMADTITEIQHRLSPEHLKDEAVAKIKDYAGRGMEMFQGTVKKAPVPFIAAAAGLSYLLLRRKRSKRRAEQATATASYASPMLNAGEPGMRPPEMNLAPQATADTVGEKARAASGKVTAMAENHPLVFGAAGVVVGAILGAVLPSSARERELLGQARESLIERAKQAGKETMQRVQDMAGASRNEARAQDGPEFK